MKISNPLATMHSVTCQMHAAIGMTTMAALQLMEIAATTVNWLPQNYAGTFTGFVQGLGCAALVGGIAGHHFYHNDKQNHKHVFQENCHLWEKEKYIPVQNALSSIALTVMLAAGIEIAPQIEKLREHSMPLYNEQLTRRDSTASSAQALTFR